MLCRRVMYQLLRRQWGNCYVSINSVLLAQDVYTSAGKQGCKISINGAESFHSLSECCQPIFIWSITNITPTQSAALTPCFWALGKLSSWLHFLQLFTALLQKLWGYRKVLFPALNFRSCLHEQLFTFSGIKSYGRVLRILWNVFHHWD